MYVDRYLAKTVATKFALLESPNSGYVQDYISPESARSILAMVPMAKRSEVLQICHNMGLKVRIKYRGPRNGDPTRIKNLRQSVCLRKDATHFSLYLNINQWDMKD